ncbi:MAG: D-alanine--D-alanine ligase family protein, partial [Flavobacteriales bacterium]
IGDEYNQHEILDQLQLPCFVKPNEAGSSLGISKVKSAEELAPAIEKAFEVNDSVMVEAFLKGREIQCGVIPINGKLQALAPTEIISENEFFDFEAKYEGKSQEITPANITETQTKLIQETSEKIYKVLNCSGFVRIDYMLDNEKVQIIEINTVPGFSKMSILPQQIQASGIEIKEAISQCIEQALT